MISIEEGGDPNAWTLEGKGRKVTNIGCTTCNVGGKGAGSGYGTMVLRHTSIGPRGGHNRGQVLVRGGGGAFIAHDVEINDLGVLLEGAQSSLRAATCRRCSREMPTWRRCLRRRRRRAGCWCRAQHDDASAPRPAWVPARAMPT